MCIAWSEQIRHRLVIPDHRLQVGGDAPPLYPGETATAEGVVQDEVGDAV